MIETWLLPHVPKAGGVALDIGANHGEWSRMLAGRFRHVFAVEPNPALAEALRSLPENVTHLPVGVWDRGGARPFTLYASDVHTSTAGDWGGNGGAAHATVDWPCTPIDALPVPHPVAFIKLDIEGAELQALRGAARTIERDRPRLIVEIHGVESGAAVSALLRAWGYTLEVVRDPRLHAGSPWYASNYWIAASPGSD